MIHRNTPVEKNQKGQNWPNHQTPETPKPEKHDLDTSAKAPNADLPSLEEASIGLANDLSLEGIPELDYSSSMRRDRDEFDDCDFNRIKSLDDLENDSARPIGGEVHPMANRREYAPLPVSSERTARAQKSTQRSKRARKKIGERGGMHKRRQRKIR